MELKEIKCKNCGASLEVENDATTAKCKFCNTTFSVENDESKGYSFEKGRIKAQKEEMKNTLENLDENLDTLMKASRKMQNEMTPLPMKIFAVFFVILWLCVFFFIVSKAFGLGKSEFNDNYEFHSGSQSIFIVEDVLDDIVTNNKGNGKHIIEVVYNDTSTTKPSEIIEIKHDLQKKDKKKVLYKVELEYDYDKNGYINKLTITDIE